MTKTSAALIASMAGTAALIATIGQQAEWLAITLLTFMVVEGIALALQFRRA